MVRFGSGAAIAAALVVSVHPAHAAQQPSIQQQFEAASTALDAQQWTEALRLFDALEQRLQAGGSARSLGLVRVRKAEALIKLGRDADAEASLQLGLPALPAGDASVAEDRFLALMALGSLRERALDYEAALERYRAAEAIAPSPAPKVRAFRGLIATGMFIDPARALADADRALAWLASQPDATKSLLSQFSTLRGRTLLNLGRFDEARKELRAAVDALGGLTLRVDVPDLAARSDMAIAALLSGYPDEARKYLAYTGAGHQESTFFDGADMDPPACGAEGNLQPDDVGVVEFSIGDDGTVQSVAPIYSTRKGDGALAFARAVAGWSWSPEEMKAIPPLFRLLTRIELRCTTSPDRPSVADILDHDYDQWVDQAALAPVPVPPGPDARRLEPLRLDLAEREKRFGSRSSQLIPVLSQLGANDITPDAEAAEHLQRAVDIARSVKAPPAVIAFLGIRAAHKADLAKGEAARRSPPDLEAILNDPLIASDARTLAAVRLEDAENRYRRAGEHQRAIELLEQVRDTSSLAPTDPLRSAALVRLASIQTARGNEGAATTAFRESGLSANQCALLDSKPRLRAGSGSYRDFPMEALRWGFEGWTLVEMDVAPDGATQNVRPTMAYPPFVFGEASTKMVRRFEYDPSFRPAGDLGCGGLRQRIVFRLPNSR